MGLVIIARTGHKNASEYPFAFVFCDQPMQIKRKPHDGLWQKQAFLLISSFARPVCIVCIVIIYLWHLRQLIYEENCWVAFSRSSCSLILRICSANMCSFRTTQSMRWCWIASKNSRLQRSTSTKWFDLPVESRQDETNKKGFIHACSSYWVIREAMKCIPREVKPRAARAPQDAIAFRV